jgi:hypothetical protein
MQFLLKQSPTAVDDLATIFKLTSEEKKRLIEFPIGQGLFFAGSNHVHIQIVASPTEASLITTNPGPLQKNFETEAQTTQVTEPIDANPQLATDPNNLTG